jgi:hypothetical protein
VRGGLKVSYHGNECQGHLFPFQLNSSIFY